MNQTSVGSVLDMKPEGAIRSPATLKTGGRLTNQYENKINYLPPASGCIHKTSLSPGCVVPIAKAWLNFAFTTPLFPPPEVELIRFTAQDDGML